jgi:hypothetical protein
MAQIKIEDIVDHLDSEMKRALEDAVKRVIPGAEFDRDRLFQEFRQAVYQHCSIWENVPDRFVR